MFWNLDLLSVPNDRSPQGLSWITYPFVWAIMFNREIISPADRGYVLASRNILGYLGDCCNSFFVFVSDRSRSDLAENLSQIRFFLSCAVNKNRLFLPFLSSVGIPPQVPPDWKRGRCYWTSGKFCNAAISPATMRM